MSEELTAEEFLRGKGLTGDFKTKRIHLSRPEKGELLVDWFDQYAKAKTEEKQRELKAWVGAYDKEFTKVKQLQKEVEQTSDDVESMRVQSLLVKEENEKLQTKLDVETAVNRLSFIRIEELIKTNKS